MFLAFLFFALWIGTFFFFFIIRISDVCTAGYDSIGFIQEEEIDHEMRFLTMRDFKNSLSIKQLLEKYLLFPGICCLHCSNWPGNDRR